MPDPHAIPTRSDVQTDENTANFGKGSPFDISTSGQKPQVQIPRGSLTGKDRENIGKMPDI